MSPLTYLNSFDPDCWAIAESLLKNRNIFHELLDVVKEFSDEKLSNYEKCEHGMNGDFIEIINRIRCQYKAHKDYSASAFKISKFDKHKYLA